MSGYFRGIPLCPIYGFGGILLLNCFILLNGQPYLLVVFLTTLSVIGFEYTGGWLAEHLLDERLWDYSDENPNLNGYISLWHSSLWWVGVNTLYLLFINQQRLFSYIIGLKVEIRSDIQVMILFVLFIFVMWATSKNKKIRLTKMLEKVNI